MTFINDHFLKLADSYLFADIAKRIEVFKTTHPQAEIIRLGIGDVTRPLPSTVIKEMHQAVEEMASNQTFHGYGPEQGYRFLIDRIIEHDYAQRGIHSITVRCSSTTEQRAIWGTFPTYSVMTTVLPSPTQYIQYTLTPT